jgi:putative chitobiose transport system substrate-binding protein
MKKLQKLKQKQKLISTFTGFGLFLSVMIACTGPNTPPSSNNKQEIEFWTMQLQPQFTNYFEKLIAEYEAANPGWQIKWVDVPWSAMESKILAAVSAQTAPDVVNLNPDFASMLAQRQAWLNLDPLVPATARQAYLPNIWQASSLNGKTFGLPWYITTEITIYNTDLLKKAGLTKPPATYQELAQVARQIKEKTGKYAFFVTFVPEDSSQVLQSFVQMGVSLVDESGKAAFNTEAGRAVFQYWVDLYQQGLLPQEVLTQGHQRAVQLYQAGETALLLTGPQFLRAIADNAPTVAKVSQPAPQISGETGKKNVAVMNLVIPQGSDVPEPALKFALFVTNPTNQLAFAKEANVLPSTTNGLTDTYFQTAGNDPASQARTVSAQQLAQAEVLIPVTTDLGKLKKAIYQNLQAAMLGQKTVEQAVNDAARQWNEK